jgi:hypothetical protein
MRRVKQVLGVLTAAAAALLVGSGGVAMASTDSVESVYSCPDWVRGYPNCADTLTAVNLRTGASSKSGYIMTVPKDYPFSLGCWANGEPINGDDVWYYGSYFRVENGAPAWTYGWLTGYWLATGHDPAPGIAHC